MKNGSIINNLGKIISNQPRIRNEKQNFSDDSIHQVISLDERLGRLTLTYQALQTKII